MSSSSFDADSTLGALLVGTLVSYALFGVATTQAYLYSGRFPDESLKMKAMVGVVWCGELAHAICIGHTIYFLVITNYGHPETLARLPSSLIASTLIGSLVSCFIQSFFAFRIWTLSRNLFIPSICWALSLFRLVPPNVVLFQHGLYEPLFDFIGEWGWLFNTAWAVSAANDLLIASTLVFLLYRRRTVSLKRLVMFKARPPSWPDKLQKLYYNDEPFRMDAGKLYMAGLVCGDSSAVLQFSVREFKLPCRSPSGE
ncbi:hypothetical protein B0H13DRAFT_1870555 [Mycena leptocephala]|nr:hypothetical protein B0H13DRAFT_1870555 [Mycena leptocephala]